MEFEVTWQRCEFVILVMQKSEGEHSRNFRAKIFIVISTSKWTYITFTGTKEFPITLETTVSLEDPTIFYNAFRDDIQF